MRILKVFILPSILIIVLLTVIIIFMLFKNSIEIENNDIALIKIPIRIESKDHFKISPFYLKMNVESINLNYENICANNKEYESICEIFRMIKNCDHNKIISHLDKDYLVNDIDQVKIGIDLYCSAISKDIDSDTAVKRNYIFDEYYSLYSSYSKSNKYMPFLIKNKDSSDFEFYFHYNYPLYNTINTIEFGFASLGLDNIYENQLITTNELNILFNDKIIDAKLCFTPIFHDNSIYSEFTEKYLNFKSNISKNEKEIYNTILGENTFDDLKSLLDKGLLKEHLLKNFPEKYDFLVANKEIIFAYKRSVNTTDPKFFFKYHVYNLSDNNELQLVNYNYIQGFDLLLNSANIQEQLDHIQ